MNAAIILSGGSGSRFCSATPKQYHLLCGKEVVEYSIDAVKSSSMVGTAIIVSDSASATRLYEKYGITCVQSGSSRNASLKNGLDYIMKHHPECQKIFITEAARAFLTVDLINKYYQLLDEYDAVITTQHITDSLGRNGEAVTDRSQYYLVQAPEAFRFALLYKYFSADSPITATVQQLPPTRRVMNYFAFKNNLKITYPEDFLLAELMIKLQREKSYE